MKKLLMGIFGLLLLFPISVYAEESGIDSIEEESNTASTTVTVGTVEVPTYRVSVSWDTPMFDYVYDNETKNYKWTPSTECSAVHDADIKEFIEAGDIFYEDNACSIQATRYTEGMQYYQGFTRDSVNIMIKDYSVNKRVVPSIK